MILKPTKFRLPIKGHWGTKGLVGSWLFNDNPPLLGKTLDVSGNRNHGTLFGDTHIVAGKFGPALSFDGNGDYIEIPYNNSSLSSSSLTVVGWVNLSNNADPQVIYQKGSTEATLSYRFFPVNGGTGNDVMLFQIAEGSARDSLTGIKVVSYGSWHQVAVTYNSVSKSAKTYLDGILDNSATFTKTMNINTDGAWIGKCEWGTTDYYYLKGSLDNLMIFNRALSASEIAQFYRQPFCMFDRERIELWSAATQGAAPGGLSIPVAMRYYRNRRVA